MRAFSISRQEFDTCPRSIINPSHWRDDRTCRCYPHVDDVDLDQFSERQLRELRVRINRRIRS